MWDAGEASLATDGSVFNHFISQQSPAQLRAVFECYSVISKSSIDEVISSEFSGDIKNGLLTIGKPKPMHYVILFVKFKRSINLGLGSVYTAY